MLETSRYNHAENIILNVSSTNHNKSTTNITKIPQRFVFCSVTMIAYLFYVVLAQHTITTTIGINHTISDVYVIKRIVLIRIEPILDK